MKRKSDTVVIKQSLRFRSNKKTELPDIVRMKGGQIYAKIHLLHFRFMRYIDGGSGIE